MTIASSIPINFDIRSQKIFDLFKKYGGRRFIFMRPDGNFGDDLIYRGAEKLASLAGIAYESIDYETSMNIQFPSEAVLYLHGSGGFNTFWSGKPMRQLAKALSTHFGVIIVGPTTFEIDNIFLTNMVLDIFQNNKSEKFYLFCREEVSYHAIKEVLPNWVALDVDHDTAFNLTISDFDRKKVKSRYLLYAIREDKEAVPFQDKDYLAVWCDPINHCKNFTEWFLLHSQAKAITTNRLHSAIIGLILEKSVTLLPNNYHKNRAVWEYSLREKGVQWTETIPLRNISQFMNTTSDRFYPIRKLLRSSKFKHVLHKYYGVI